MIAGGYFLSVRSCGGHRPGGERKGLRARKPRRKQQRERVIVSDSEQVGRPLAGPDDEYQADELGPPTAVADGSADDAAAARAAAEAGDAQQARGREEAAEPAQAGAA